jgi:hypothetical protein
MQHQPEDIFVVYFWNFRSNVLRNPFSVADFLSNQPQAIRLVKPNIKKQTLCCFYSDVVPIMFAPVG